MTSLLWALGQRSEDVDFRTGSTKELGTSSQITKQNKQNSVKHKSLRQFFLLVVTEISCESITIHVNA